jgi:LPXTG-motif cell wall-anchored protein
MSRRIGARIGVGIAAIGLLGLTGIASVGAHTGSLFTVGYGDDFEAFSTIGQSDAVVTPLPTHTTGNYEWYAVEIVGEQAYALGAISESQDDRTYYITTWDHSTGAQGAPVAITSPVPDVEFDVWALDSRADGTLLVLVELEQEGADEWVASVDPATGTLTLLIDMSGVSDFLDSLATDPTTGTSYVLADENDGLPEFLPLDFSVVPGTYSGVPIPIPAIQTALGNGYMTAADFDTAGTLWFYYRLLPTQGPGAGVTPRLSDGDLEFAVTDPTGLLASTTGVFGTTSSAVSSGNVDSPDGYSNGALAFDPVAPPAPAVLPDTGVDLSVAGFAGLTLLIVGLGAFAYTRRRTASAE